MNWRKIASYPSAPYLAILAALFGASIGGCSSKPTIGDDGGTGGFTNGGQAGTGASGFQADAAIGDASAGDSGNCGQSKIQATARPVNVAIVLDRSLSMNTALSATETKSRWIAMSEALNAALTSVQDRVAFGLKLFPDSADTCAVTSPDLQVDIQLGAASVAKISDAIANTVPAGGTPVSAALSQVLDYFTTGAGSTLSGDRVVLLATDGAPNCNSGLTCDASACIANIENPASTINVCEYDALQCLDGGRAVAQVKALLEQGIRTVVVGIPGTEYTQYQAILDQMGTEGGLPNPDPNYDYFPVSAAAGIAGLQATLQNVTKNLIVSCKLQLTSTPPDSGLLNVVIDDVTIAQSGADGWSLDTATVPPTVVLKGATCDFMETHGAKSVNITYGCPTVIIN